MNSTQIEIRRQKHVDAVTRNYNSVLYLINAIVSIIFVAYLLYFVFDGILSSEYTDFALGTKQDSDSVFLSVFLIAPFAIWRILKAVSSLVLYITGRSAAKKNTKIRKTGISFMAAFSSGESITMIAVLALGGFYTILMSYAFYAAVDKKTKEPLFGTVESYLPFVLFVICMVVGVVAVMYLKSASQTMLLILQNKDTYKKISPIPGYLSFATGVLPIIIAFVFNPANNAITSHIVEKHDRLVALVNMVYVDGFFTVPFIILLVLMLGKFVVSGLVYLKASKAGISDTFEHSLEEVA